MEYRKVPFWVPCFLLFFNDLIDSVNVNVIVIKYANDTVFYYASEKSQQIEDTLDNEMKKIGKYCADNELILNLKKRKTELMLFRTNIRLKAETLIAVFTRI